jgi:transcriptional regulator with GAF, ATPase, and Fis domain
VGAETYSADLRDGLQRLGRDADNDVIVKDDSVSRHQCLLLVSHAGVEIVDQESKNGTFVEGKRIDRAVVGAGTALRFGHVELRLEGLDPADARLALEIVPFDDVPSSRGEAVTTLAATGDGSRWSELNFPPGYVVGASPAMTRLHDQIWPAARSQLPVLIVGETGVGKELVARLVHRSSSRRDGPLVAINCAAIPKDLLEAELFGIGERVATGVAGRAGKFRQADGGSLFLDEIGEMSAELQAKLLRVLQEGRVEPLGERPFDIDVRLVAATNSNLEELIESDRFRRDLYYRLAGFVLEVPPLRERPEDVLPLVEHLVRDTAYGLGKRVRGLTHGALQQLLAHRWPGNVRELEHLVRRLVHLCPARQAIDSLLLADAGFTVSGKTPPPFEAAESVPPPSALTALPDLNLERLEREAIREALRRSGGQLKEAAELLGLSRFSLRRRMGRHGLSSEDNGT